MNATALRNRMAAVIRQRGQKLTVTRPATSQGGTATTRSVYFLPQPLKDSGNNFMIEGAGNVAEPNDHDFVCVGGSDVQEKDIIGPYLDAYWRVNNTNESPLSGTAPTMHCFATREGQT
jgi:hypothetical protein